MKILDLDHAQNWAQKQLKYPFVLVDEDGNIRCLTKLADAQAVADQKAKEGKTLHVVRGQLPAPETPVNEPEKSNDGAK